MSFLDDLYHQHEANGTIFGAEDYSDRSSNNRSSSNDDNDDEDTRSKGKKKTQESEKYRFDQAERISKGTNKSREKIAQLDRDSQRKLQEQQDRAALERSQAEIAARLQISNNEITAQMARLEKELGVRREDLANQLTMSRERLGFDREQLAANVQIERDKLAHAKDEMERIGIPKMLADKWYQEQQVQLAQSAQQIDRERLKVERGKLGLDAFTKAVELASNPATRFQFGDFATGLAANAQARDWTAALTDAVNQSGFGQAVDAGVQPMTPQSALAAMLGFLGAGAQPGAQEGAQAAAGVPGVGAPAGVGTDNYQRPVLGTDMDTPGDEQAGAPGRTAAVQGAPDAMMSKYYGDLSKYSPEMQAYLRANEAQLGQIEKVADAGASSLAPGALESLGETGLAEFVSGLKKLRRDPELYMKNYQKSRPAQGQGPEASWSY